MPDPHRPCHPIDTPHAPSYIPHATGPSTTAVQSNTTTSPFLTGWMRQPADACTSPEGSSRSACTGSLYTIPPSPYTGYKTRGKTNGQCVCHQEAAAITYRLRPKRRVGGGSSTSSPYSSGTSSITTCRLGNDAGDSGPIKFSSSSS
jgi:hypothetical protein